MIQGVATTGSAWQPQVEGLSADHALLTFDNRGIGKSPLREPISIEAMAADARELLDEVGWEQAHVVGHSMGGLIAQQLALEHPGRVKSLALLCTFSRGPEAARLTLQTLRLGLRTRLGTRAMRRNAFLDILWSRQGLAGHDREALARDLAPLLGRDLADNPAIALRQLQAMRRHDLSSRLFAIKVPTLVVSGDEDPIALWPFGQHLAERIPGARYVKLDHAAHGLTLEWPERVNQLLREHFNK